MFSTLGKADVSFKFPFRKKSPINKTYHSQKKRHIAGQYANTNILRPDVTNGVQDRAAAFVQKCIESKGLIIDAYVRLRYSHL